MSHIVANHRPPLALHLCLVLDEINPGDLATLNEKTDTETVLVSQVLFAPFDIVHLLTVEIIRIESSPKATPIGNREQPLPLEDWILARQRCTEPVEGALPSQHDGFSLGTLHSVYHKKEHTLIGDPLSLWLWMDMHKGVILSC